MISEDMPAVAIQGDFAPIPKTPKPTIWDWFKFYAYNWSRRPLVWKRRRELLRIADEIRLSLEPDLLKDLSTRRQTCDECRDAYVALKSQVFVSQIETILQRMACSEHPDEFRTFREKNSGKFERSRVIADWICRPSR